MTATREAHTDDTSPARADYADRNDVIEQYAPLVRRIAYRLVSRLPANVELDDLVSAGVFGLIDAAEKYEESMGVFEYYASIRIRGAMLDELRSLDWVPRSVRQMAATIDDTRQQLARELGRDAEDAEVAEALDMDISTFHRKERRARPRVVVGFGDLGTNDAEARNALECIPDPQACDPEENSARYDERALMVRAIQQLPERQRVVLGLYYFDDYKLREIGDLLGVTESRISQIHTQAVQMLKPIVSEMMNESV